MVKEGGVRFSRSVQWGRRTVDVLETRDARSTDEVRADPQFRALLFELKLNLTRATARTKN